MVLANIYTGDKTWARYDNPRFFMWAGVDVAKPTRVRPSIRGEKLMIWVYFSLSGIDSMTALSAKETFARPFFIDKVLGISTSNWRRHGQRTVLVTLFCNSTTPHTSGE
jgi:hypothetical protein